MRSRGPGSQRTLCWREPDSNHRFRLRYSPWGSSLIVSADLPRFPPENEVRSGLSAGGRWIRTFGSRTRHQAVRPRRGRFPVIGSSPHWPGGTGISNLRPLAGWISALERGRFQGHKQKRKPKSVAPFARNRKFESISLQRRVRLSPQAAFEGREPRLSARLCAAGLATGSAETRRVFKDRANRRQYLCRAIFQYRSAADGIGENATPVPIQSGPSPSAIMVDLCA